MSLKEWKEKYYPVDAFDVSYKDALDHSIKKWEGLQADVLKEYGLVQSDNVIGDGNEYMVISGETCSLCCCYIDIEADNPCSQCPLAQSRDGIPCDDPTAYEKTTPYSAFLLGNAKPMLHALRLAKTLQESQNEQSPE